MFCMNCGKKIDDGSKFCQFCGSPIKNNVNQSMPHQQPQIPVGKKVNPFLVGGIGLGCLVVVLCGVRFLASDKQDSPAEVAVTESAPVEDNSDEPVSTPADATEGEETSTDNNIYYLSESDVTNQLQNFFNFCWSNSTFNNNRDLGQDTIDLGENSFRSLYAITVNKSMDVGLVAIYETNPNLILTSDFAETCLAGGCSAMDSLIMDVCREKNSIEFKGSNIDGTWHFYDGTDECVYVAVSARGYNFTIELVQCTGDPYRWLINDVDRDLNQDLLDAKLKNEDDTSMESDSVAEDSVSEEQDDEFLSAYTDYVEEVLSNKGILGYNLIYIDADDTPECVVWTRGEYDGAFCRAFVLSYKNGSIESVTVEGEEGVFATVGYIPGSGDFWVSSSDWHWSYDDIFSLDDSFHKVKSMFYCSGGYDNQDYLINGKAVNSEEYYELESAICSNEYSQLFIDMYEQNFNDIYSTLTAAYDAL